MFGTPSFDSPLTYFGVLLVTIGIYLALSGFGILKIEKYATPEGTKSWGTGLFLVLLGLAVLFVFPAYQAYDAKQQEVSILECQNNPDAAIIDSETSVTLVWGWITDSQAKREEIISISSFIVEVDGVTQDLDRLETVLKSNNSVYWKLPIGNLSPGTHKITLVRIFSQEFTDSDGIFSAGRQQTDVCELMVASP